MWSIELSERRVIPIVAVSVACRQTRNRHHMVVPERVACALECGVWQVLIVQTCVIEPPSVHGEREIQQFIGNRRAPEIQEGCVWTALVLCRCRRRMTMLTGIFVTKRKVTPIDSMAAAKSLIVPSAVTKCNAQTYGQALPSTLT